MKFELATAARIVFGAGSLSGVASAAKEFGSRALLVTSESGLERAEPVRRLLDRASVLATSWVVRGEPTIDQARAGTARARENGCDVVIAMGGGSAIDAGKAIAALLTNSADPLEYIEVIGRGLPLVSPAAPFIAIPTTAGTGSEVTRNAVLGSPEHGVKVSLRSQHLLPRVALIDPELTYGLPPSITASTGLDALTQLIEPFVCKRANAFTDRLCLDGLQRASTALARVYRNGRDVEARTEMSYAAMLSGMALANAGLGAVHGFAAPLGGRFHAPHGAVCAALLPHATRVNITALLARAPESPALARYRLIAGILAGNERTEALIPWLEKTGRVLEVRPLRSYGMTAADSDEIVARAQQASSMKANPIELTEAELREVFLSAL